jgi:predicted aldo/keto reductase-like oxidoreductase
MAKTAVGSTGILVERNGFGALPIQRISVPDAVKLLRRAYDGGMEYYDTARAYTDSEEKLGLAFGDMRDRIVLATKTMAQDVKSFWGDLEKSLTMLKTDCIDLYQFHNPPFCPKPGDASGLYDAAMEARRQGKIRFIGMTNHRMDIAQEAVDSGLYDTLQYPLSYISLNKETQLVSACRDKGIGFIAMKALCGGLLTNATAASAWIARFDNVIPIWGIQRERELDEFLKLIAQPPTMTDELMAVIEADRKALSGGFCRGCGYCMPCPQGIVINMCARASLLMRRGPKEFLVNEAGIKMMRRVSECIDCGQCASRCPYGLDTPALLKENYRDFEEILAGKPI